MNDMPPTLAALQSAFQQHLLGEPRADANAHSITRAIAPGGIGAERRLAIYHHAYRARLVETLRDTFGHTLLYLGDDWFDSAAREHVERHPSRHASLRWYGADFPRFLAERHAQDAEIGELATLDWALRRAFDGPDAAVLTLADLAAVPPQAWAGVRLRLHPTLERLRLQHNTLALWQALDQDQIPPAAAALAEPGELLVWRRGHSPHFRSLEPFEAAALDHLQLGLGFAALCDRLAATFPDRDTASQAGALLRRWVDDEMLCGLEID